MNGVLQRYKEFAVDFDPDAIIIKPTLRVNTLRITPEKLCARLSAKGVSLTPVSFLPDAFYYEASFALASTIEYLSGLFYLQELASQLPARVLLAEQSKNDSSITVLDMCAAPGSKTTQLAQLTNDKARIVALDDSMPRIKALQSNLQRLGITSVAVFKKDARFADDIGVMFDYVLLDAPCSGNFCVEPDFFKKRTPQDFKDRAHLQKDLLKSAHKVLKKGGVLVYSTCSLEPEENELVIDWFLKKYTDMSLEPVTLPLGDDGYTQVFDQTLASSLSLTKRFWPHKTGTQGFFIAKLKKAL